MPDRLKLKHEYERNTPITVDGENLPYFEDDVFDGEVFTTVEDEYRAMERFYELIPGNVAEPVMPEYVNGEIQGFYMQKIDGLTLSEHLEQGVETLRVDPVELARELEDIVETLYNTGEVHGDLGPHNILMEDGATPKIIDPIGYPRGFEHLDRAHDHDQHQIEDIKDRLGILDIKV